MPNLAAQVLGGTIDNLVGLLRSEGPLPVAWKREKEFVEFCESCWELGEGRGNAQPMPSIQNDRNVQDDDGLEISSRVSLICPITHQQLVQPMKNPRCGHVYSMNAIQALQGRGGYNIECPVAGCGSVVVMNSLTPDRKCEELLRRLDLRLFEQSTSEVVDYSLTQQYTQRTQ